MLESVLKYFVHRKRATLFIFVLILIYGFIAYKTIPKESSPDIDIPYIYVTTIYDGISPEDSEKLLTKPIENELRDIEGLKQITSYSNESTSSIILEFEAGFDSKRALEDVRAKVSDAESQLPDDVDEPVIEELNISLFPVLNIFLAGDLPLRTLRQYAEDLQEKIEAISEVLEANISGIEEEVVEIEIEPKDIDTYNLSLSQLESIFQGNNRLVAAGILRTKTGDFALKVPGLIETYRDFLEFPIMASGDRVLKVQDIARVKRTFKDPESIVRVNGKSALSLEVVKRKGENIIETVAKVKEVIDEEIKFWPKNIQLIFSQDESQNIKDFVADLENTIFIGVLLVMSVILLSVSAKSALLIALSIPSAFLAAILFIDAMGITLNIVVLFSLILTVGMIVDDAIVISEYADIQMQRGMDPKKAFPHAAHRMFWPVFTSTVVKIVVFMPLLFWPNIIGQFMLFMPITVICVLINSSIYATVFQPSIGILLGKPKSYHKKMEDLVPSKLDLAKLDPFRKKYAKLLMKVLGHAKKFTLGIFGLLVLIYIFFIAAGPGSEFFPSIEPDNAYITIQSTDNLSIQEIDEKLSQLEQIVLEDLSEIKVLYFRAGKQSGQSDDFPQNTIGYLLLEFEDWELRRKASEILADFKERFENTIKGVKLEIIEERKGPVTGKPIEMNFSGRDPAMVNEFADKLITMMNSDPDYKGIEDSRSTRELEWELVIDRAKLATYGVDLRTIGAAVRLMTEGFEISEYTPDDSDEEIDVVVRFPPQFRKLMALDQINVITQKGSIPLTQLVKPTPNIKVTEIKRVDRKKVITIMSDVHEDVLVNNKLKELYKFLEDEKFSQAGVAVEFLGDEEEQQETGAFLVSAFLLALLLMFLVMLIQFNSFYHTVIVMSAVFLSSVGVLIAHIVTWQPFGIVMSGVGIIALGGIVLNNNILYIDTYQRLRESRVPFYDAIVMAGVERLRPILLTAFTAVLGLLPMVLGLTINLYDRTITYDAPSSQWWRQLSSSIAGGLTFATVLTLFFTPCLLMMGQRFDRKFEEE